MAENTVNTSDAKGQEGPKSLDLAFAMDCTGSMGSYIHQAQQNIRKIVEDIVSKESADVRLALVEYRDHPPQDSSFITRVHDFTGSVRKMKEWLDNSNASGGGDQAEAVADALHQLLKLSWRDEATKIGVFIADAPPHGLGCGGDGFPNGCPDGLDPMPITNQLAEKGVTLYMVGCEPSIVPFRDFFMSLADITGGQYVPLGSATLLTKVILGGAQEEISLQQLMDEVNQEVTREVEQAGSAPVAYDELWGKVHTNLQAKGVKTKQLLRNNANLSETSAQAKAISSFGGMAEVKKNFKQEHAPFGPPPTASRSFGRVLCAPAPPPPGGPLAFGGSPMAFGGSSMTTNAAPPPPGASFSFGSGPPAPPQQAAPAQMRAAPSSFGSASDTYDVREDDISEQQVQRMVQKSMMQNALKSKVTKSKPT